MKSSNLIKSLLVVAGVGIMSSAMANPQPESKFNLAQCSANIAVGAIAIAQLGDETKAMAMANHAVALKKQSDASIGAAETEKIMQAQLIRNRDLLASEKGSKQFADDVASCVSVPQK